MLCGGTRAQRSDHACTRKPGEENRSDAAPHDTMARSVASEPIDKSAGDVIGAQRGARPRMARKGDIGGMASMAAAVAETGSRRNPTRNWPKWRAMPACVR